MAKESYKQGLKDFNDFLLWVKYEDTKMTMMDGPSENFKKIFELFSEKLNKKVDNLYSLLETMHENPDIMSDLIDIWRKNTVLPFKEKVSCRENPKDYIMTKPNVHYTELHKDDIIFLNGMLYQLEEIDSKYPVYTFRDICSGIIDRRLAVDMNNPFTINNFLLVEKIDKDNLEDVDDLDKIVNLKYYIEIPLEKLPVGAKFKDYIKETSLDNPNKPFKSYNYVKVKIENAPSNNYYKEYILGFNYNASTVKYFDSNYESDMGYLRDLEDGEIFYIDGIGYRKVGSDLAESDVIYDTVVSLKDNVVVSMRKQNIVYI